MGDGWEKHKGNTWLFLDISNVIPGWNEPLHMGWWRGGAEEGAADGFPKGAERRRGRQGTCKRRGKGARFKTWRV